MTSAPANVWLNISDDARGSVGYWLLSEARGRGLATRSVRMVSRWGLEALHLARVQLATEPANQASQRVAERAGFRREGVLRSFGVVAGRRVDYLMFSRLPGDVDTAEDRPEPRRSGASRGGGVS